MILISIVREGHNRVVSFDRIFKFHYSYTLCTIRFITNEIIKANISVKFVISGDISVRKD